jgi:hypothetical protein
MEVKGEYVKKLLEKTELAAESVKPMNENGENVLAMARRYASDARHFFESGELVNSFAAIEYAHGLLDGGVGSGALEVLENEDLFVF